MATQVPHIHSSLSVPKIIGADVLALTPALLAAVFRFGWPALLSAVLSCAAAIGAEAAARTLFKKKITLYDLSAVLNGLLFFFLMPPGTPPWLTAAASFFSVFIVKELYGGLAANLFQPALAGAAFLWIAFPQRMTHGEFPADIGFFYFLAGGLYLIWKRPAGGPAPLVYLAVFLLADLVKAQPAAAVLSGPVFFAAFFLVTDFSTTPMTRWGSALYAAAAAGLAGSLGPKPPEMREIVFSLLFMNALTPWIDHFIRPAASYPGLAR